MLDKYLFLISDNLKKFATHIITCGGSANSWGIGNGISGGNIKPNVLGNAIIKDLNAYQFDGGVCVRFFFDRRVREPFYCIRLDNLKGVYFSGRSRSGAGMTIDTSELLFTAADVGKPINLYFSYTPPPFDYQAIN